MKKLIIFFLLIIIIINLSGCENEDIINKDLKVVVGTSGLIDGYNAIYDEEINANWKINSFKWQNNGDISLDMTFYYNNKNTDMKYIGSIGLIQLFSTQKYTDENVNDWAHYPATEIIPIVLEHNNEFNSNLVLKEKIIPKYTSDDQIKLEGYEIKISWVRVFRNGKSKMYYQWLQGNNDIWQEENKIYIDNEYDDLKGDFLAYKLIPEDATSTIIDGLEYEKEFDYVKWINKNIR